MKNTSYGGDLLAAFSLANISIIDLWDGLLNYTPSQAFFWEHAPPGTEYAAAFTTVALLGLVFFLFIRLARWIAARFGTLGLIFGSIPILLGIALPAGKALVRLIVSRNSDWELPMVLLVLAGLLVAAAAVARSRFFAFASAALVTISPLIPIEAVLAIVRCSKDRSAEYTVGPLAARIPQTTRPRVVWIIFDELDYRLSFEDRPSNVPMEAFDRLRAQSLFAENAFSPANDTIPSVPSLLTGEALTLEETPSGARMLLAGIVANATSTIFSSVHAMGGNAAVVGWYLPYCRLFSRDLAACSFHEMENELSEPAPTFAQSLSVQQQSLFAYGHRSLLGDAPRSKKRIEMLASMRRDALRDVVDPSLNMVLLHLPVPHAPYLYDRFTYSFPRRYLDVGSYYDNLALADVVLTDLREGMTQAGLWDRTTVIVTSDHPDRMSKSVDGQEDARVPFLLKMAGQTMGTTYPGVLHTLVTKSLLEAILQGTIKTSEDAKKWLDAHPR